VQLCVVHLIRASLRYASKRYWAPLTRDLKLIYTAAGQAAAAAALEAFAGQWEARYPAIIKLWRAHWSEFTPFLAFPPEVRRVIYTTNLIESMNARLRKVTRNRGQFPSEQAALKVLYLAVRNLEEFRSPSAGIRSPGWKQALQAFHDLLRRANPDPMKTATVTYTDGRTLPPRQRALGPVARCPACLRTGFPSVPFPTSASGSPWGGVRSGTAQTDPRRGVCAGRRDKGHRVRPHSGRTPCTGCVRLLCENRVADVAEHFLKVSGHVQ
jgi:hypothetical protein